MVTLNNISCGRKAVAFLIILTMLLFSASPSRLHVQAEEQGSIGPSVFEKAYITSFSTGVVDVINLKDNTVEIGKIQVGNEPNSAAINPNGTQVYITNRGSNSVSVIDPMTDTVIKTITVGIGPVGVAFNQDGSKAYIANSLGEALTIIDTVQLQVVEYIAVVGGPVGLVAVDDFLYISRLNGSEILVLDLLSDTIVGEITVGTGAYGISVNPARTKLYVALSEVASVAVIDIVDRSISATISVGQQPTATEVSPDGSRVYVVNSLSSSLSVIDAETNEVIDTIAVGASPFVVGVSRDGKYIYTVNYWSDNVSVIDAETNTVIETIGVSPGPFMVGTFMLTTAVSAEIGHTITFGVEAGNGSITAQANGADIATGDNAVTGTEIIFTATPDAGYQVKEWTLNGNIVLNNSTNNLIIENLNEDANATVEFQLIDIGLESITDLVKEREDLSTLLAALETAELDEVLRGDGPFTLFAPNDEAFKDLLEALTIEAGDLLEDENLAEILVYHVAGEKLMAEDLTDGMEIETLNGQKLIIKSGSILVNEAMVIEADIEANNGVIHIIDEVLLPELKEDDDDDDDQDLAVDAVMWLPPINLESFTVNNGSTLPIKFTLTGTAGEVMTQQQSVTLAVYGPENGMLISWDAASGLKFEYDEEEDQWFYLAHFRTSDFMLEDGQYTAVVYTQEEAVLGEIHFSLKTANTKRQNGR